MVKRLGDERVRGDNPRQALVELLHRLSVLNGIQSPLIGRRLEHSLSRSIQRNGSNPGHRVLPHFIFRSSWEFSTAVAGALEIEPGALARPVGRCRASTHAETGSPKTTIMRPIAACKGLPRTSK